MKKIAFWKATVGSDSATKIQLSLSLSNKPFIAAFLDWVLKTDHGLDGDSLSYLDMMERNKEEENRRARERIIMEEGRLVFI